MIYLIEKAWIEPLENEVKSSRGYLPYAYTDSKQVADEWENKGFYTKADCWSISSKMPYFRITELKKVE